MATETEIEAVQRVLEEADLHLHMRMDSVPLVGDPAREIAEDVIAALDRVRADDTRDDYAADRAMVEPCRFVFPGYLVPRTEMVHAVLNAAAGGEGWQERLPAKAIARGEALCTCPPMAGTDYVGHVPSCPLAGFSGGASAGGRTDQNTK